MDSTRPIEVSQRAPSYLELRRRVAAFAALFAVFVLIAALVGFAELRASALESARERGQSYSNILSAHLERTIVAIDARLAQIALQSERLGGPAGSPEQWLPVLDAARAGAPTIGSLSITDVNGRIRHSTIRAIIGADRRDRFLSRSLSNPEAPDLMSDAPMISPTSGALLLPFGRRLVGSQGRTVGTVVATFVPESLRDFYRSIDTEGGAIRILHATGALVLAEPGATPAPPPNDPVLAAHRAGYPRGYSSGRWSRAARP